MSKRRKQTAMNAAEEAASPPAKADDLQMPGPQATSVCLAGDFNAWGPDSVIMARIADGSWPLELDLEPGGYEHKFVIDGPWHCEPGCETPEERPSRCVSNPFGTKNSVVEVA